MEDPESYTDVLHSLEINKYLLSLHLSNNKQSGEKGMK